jgi:hypothetical protein
MKSCPYALRNDRSMVAVIRRGSRTTIRSARRPYVWMHYVLSVIAWPTAADEPPAEVSLTLGRGHPERRITLTPGEAYELLVRDGGMQARGIVRRIDRRRAALDASAEVR